MRHLYLIVCHRNLSHALKTFYYANQLFKVDKTFMIADHLGILLVDVAQNGNCVILPIAYAIVEGER